MEAYAIVLLVVFFILLIVIGSYLWMWQQIYNKVWKLNKVCPTSDGQNKAAKYMTQQLIKKFNIIKAYQYITSKNGPSSSKDKKWIKDLYAKALAKYCKSSSGGSGGTGSFIPYSPNGGSSPSPTYIPL